MASPFEPIPYDEEYDLLAEALKTQGIPSQAKFDSHVGQYVDSVFKKNAKIPFVDRIINPNNLDKYSFLPFQENGFEGKQTHRMTDAGTIVYPEISTTAEPGTLEHLTGDAAYNKAVDTGNFIEFPTEAAARWFAANGYKNSEQTKNYMEDLQKLNLPSQSFKVSFLELVKDMENDTQKGFNQKTKTWFPHESPEKGNDTIAFGHKLSDEEQANNYVYIGNEKVPFSELTTEKATELFLQDWDKATTDAEKWFKDDWESLTQQNKLLATELIFNMGLTKVADKDKGFKNFKEKAINNNPDVLNEINRTYKKDGKNVRTGRGDKIRRYISEVEKT